jgi:hypothetical protein
VSPHQPHPACPIYRSSLSVPVGPTRVTAPLRHYRFHQRSRRAPDFNRPLSGVLSGLPGHFSASAIDLINPRQSFLDRLRCEYQAVLVLLEPIGRLPEELIFDGARSKSFDHLLCGHAHERLFHKV